MSHRNVLLLIADDWSPIAGCYGNEVIKMPSVDALAARGTLFQHAFCTTPSCAASRANLLTGHYSHTHGQYGHSHGIHNFHTHLTMPSVPKVLQAAGFQTGVVGKLHVQPESVYPWHYEAGGGRNVRGIADNIAAFFETIDREQPFYLHVGFSDPHRDFGNTRTYPGVPETAYSPDEVIVPDFLPDHPDARREFAEYYQSVSRLDTGIGMAVRALQDAGRDDDTMIIVMSDHGMPFPGAKPPRLTRATTARSSSCVPMQRPSSAMPWSTGATSRRRFLTGAASIRPRDCLKNPCCPFSTRPIPKALTKPFFAHVPRSHQLLSLSRLARRKYKYVRNLYPELTTPLPSDLWASPTWQAIRRENLNMGKRRTEKFLHQDAEALFDMKTIPWNPPTSLTTPQFKTSPKPCAKKSALSAEKPKTPGAWRLTTLANRG